jgi:hypothetical protein
MEQPRGLMVSSTGTPRQAIRHGFYRARGPPFKRDHHLAVRENITQPSLRRYARGWIRRPRSVAEQQVTSLQVKTLNGAQVAILSSGNPAKSRP